MINYNFLKDNKSKLIDIYIKERYMENNNKEGSLIINFSVQDKVDVYYLTVDNMPDRIKDKYIEDFHKKPNVENKKKVCLIIVDGDILETIIHYLD